MNSKEFYENRYHPQKALSKANIRLYNEIINQIDSGTIFEFGCNIGRHLQRLSSMGYDCEGIELSKKTVENALKGFKISVGDEAYLKGMEDDSKDVVFTNSVLCHIERVDGIIEDLIRISSKAVYLCECVTKQHDYWWIHKYEDYGFEECLTIDSSLKDKNSATYKIFKLEK